MQEGPENTCSSSTGATRTEDVHKAPSSTASEIIELPISREWLVATIESAVIKEKTSALKVKSVACKRLGGIGCLALIVVVSIEWSQSSDSLPNTVVLKIPCMSKMKEQHHLENSDHQKQQKQELQKLEGVTTDDEQAEFQNYIQSFFENELHVVGHRNESTMYAFLCRHGANNVPPVLIPHYYGSYHVFSDDVTQQPFLLVGDLTKSAKTPWLLCGLNEAQCRELVRSVAKLQAYGIAYSSWNNGTLTDVGLFKGFPGFAKIAALKLRGLYPKEFKITDEQLNTVVCEARNSEIINAPRLLSEGKLHPALVHGDMGCNNMLFSVDASTGNCTDKLAAIIDWQISHPGSITEDLTRIFHLCLDGELRQRIEHDLLRFYYETLKASLADYGIASAAVPFSYDDVIKSYRRNFCLGALILVGWMQFYFDAHSLQLAEANANRKPDKPVLEPVKLLSETAAARQEEEQKEFLELKQKFLRKGELAMLQAYEIAMEIKKKASS